MKITALNNGLQLEEVFEGIILKSESGDTFSICMRDDGFEFFYAGTWWAANNGKVSCMKNKKNKKNDNRF